MAIFDAFFDKGVFDVSDQVIDAIVGAMQRRVQRCITFKTGLIGYAFFEDSANGDIEYRKTTDGGATWGSSSVVFSFNDGFSLDVVADWDIPGDSGSNIHIWALDGGTSDVKYRNLDTSTDTLGTERTVFNGSSADSIQNNVRGTKTRGGNLICIYDIDGGTEHGAKKSTDGGVNWTTIADPTEAWFAVDYWLPFPGNEADNQDVYLLFGDRSDSLLTLKVYDDSGDSWSEVSMPGTPAIAFQEAGSYGHHFNGMVRKSNGHLIAVIATNRDNASTDLLAFDITNAATITAKTDVITNQDDWFNPVVIIDQGTGDLYVGYVGKADGSETIGTSVTVAYKKSTDGGTTWGSEVIFSNSAYNVQALFPSSGSRFEPAYWVPTVDDLITNYPNSFSIEPPPPQNFTAVALAIEWELPQAVAAFDQAFTAVAVVIEWELPQATAIHDQAFTAVANVIEWETPQALSAFGAVFAASANVIEWELPQASMLQGQTFTAVALAIEWVLPEAAITFGDLATTASPNVIRWVLPRARTVLPSVTVDPTEIPAVHRATSGSILSVHIHNPWWPRQRVATFTTAHNIDRSWERMAPGRAAFHVALNDPQMIRADFKGYLAVIESAVTKPWAGTILTTEESDTTGVMEVSCLGIEAILDGRVTPQNLHYQRPIGGNAVFHSLVEAANARNHTGILPSLPIELAPPVEELQVGGQSVMEALNELVGRNGFEWWVDVESTPRWVNATVYMGFRQGADLSGTLHVHQGVHYASTYKSDLSQAKQTVVAVGGFGSLLRERTVVGSSAGLGPDIVGIDADGFDESWEAASRLIANMPAGARNEKISFEVMTDVGPEVGRRAKTLHERPLAGTELLNYNFNNSVDWRLLQVGNYFTDHRRIKGQPAIRLARVKGFQPDEETGSVQVVAEVPLQ